MPPSVAAPRVTILLATHNGEAYLAQQLDSLAQQSYQNWCLHASDDGSSDASVDILRAFAAQQPQGRVRLFEGPRQGAAANFRALLRRRESTQDALAFCDQDDVWDHDHLTRALQFLSGCENPLAIFGARLRICDAQLRPRGLSPLPRRGLGFQNALVQNVLSGNTMVLSSKAHDLLCAAEREAPPLPLHDWWAYQLVTGAGGTALYDHRPHVDYRQHGRNLVGANQGFRALGGKLQRYLGGGYGKEARHNVAILRASILRFTVENQRALNAFGQALDAPLWQRAAQLRRAGVYFQSRKAQAAFFTSTALGRI